MKKVARLPYSTNDGGASGSVPMKGDATSVPISLRDRRLFWFGSATAVTSELGMDGIAGAEVGCCSCCCCCGGEAESKVQ